MLSLCLLLFWASRACAISPGIPDGHWVDTWAAMPQLTEPANLPAAPYNASGVVFANSTIRQTLRVSVAAQQIRLSVSNAFGLSDLTIDAMTVALPFNDTVGKHEIVPGSVQSVTFSGQSSYTIATGAVAFSDPLDFEVKALSILTLTIYLAAGQKSSTNAVTSHPGSRTTIWYTNGNQVDATTLTGTTLASVAHWYFISSVQAWTVKTIGSLVIIGDSITDGRGSTTDANDRWPDQLLARLQSTPSTQNIAVINQAAGGNRILADGLGPNVLARIDRDMLAHPGTRYALLFEGVNDIGTAGADAVSQAAVAMRLIAAYKQIIARVHALGIPVFGATITPFCAPGCAVVAGGYSAPARETARQTVNTWIRTSGLFDAVVDFDEMVADGTTLAAEYDSGDYLHLNPAGYARMADAFPVDVFATFSEGVVGFV